MQDSFKGGGTVVLSAFLKAFGLINNWTSNLLINWDNLEKESTAFITNSVCLYLHNNTARKQLLTTKILTGGLLQRKALGKVGCSSDSLTNLIVHNLWKCVQQGGEVFFLQRVLGPRTESGMALQVFFFRVKWGLGWLQRKQKRRTVGWKEQVIAGRLRVTAAGECEWVCMGMKNIFRY